jgi:hypothetical protein
LHPVAVIGLTNCGHSVERFYNIGLSPLTNPGSITDKEIIDDILAINGRERIMSRFFEEARGKELEYRIVAVNKAGDGEPSNTVMVVL